jgi:hypothetical protein
MWNDSAREAPGAGIRAANAAGSGAAPATAENSSKDMSVKTPAPDATAPTAPLGSWGNVTVYR